MGWLRGSGNPSKHLHNLAGRIEVESQESIYSKATYPIQPKDVKDADLPFIPSDEVMKRQGQEGCKLCESTYRILVPTTTMDSDSTSLQPGIVVDNVVLDCTTFISRHPGGRQIIQGFAGQDCGWQWWTIHDRKTWNEVAMTIRVGRTKDVENKHVRPETILGHR